MQRLLRFADRLWRLLATGFCFLLFGFGSLLGGTIVIPLLWLFVRDPVRRRRSARAFTGVLLRAFTATTSALGLLSWRVTGLQRVVPARSYLIVANHPSLIDVVFLLTLFPQATCVVKDALWRNPFTALTVRALGYISNRSPVEMLQQCIGRLRDGASIILFPEGTRTKPGCGLRFQEGAAAVAVRAECDLLPVLIRCEPATLTKGEPWYRIPPRRIEFLLAVQSPVNVRSVIGSIDSKRAATARLNQYMLDLFEQRLAARAVHR